METLQINPNCDQEIFLESFISWASKQCDIEGVALAGSHARQNPQIGSDIDLIILSSNRCQYLQESSWLCRFGRVNFLRRERWGAVETIRSTYVDDLEVEYNFAESSWAELPVDPGTRKVVQDGFRILFDRHGKLAALAREVSNAHN